MTRRPIALNTSLAAAAFAALLSSTTLAHATPALLVDLDSGDVLESQEATRNWYPASITKLMTAYVSLNAVREGRITLDTPMVVSQRAARMAPSKMGFKPGSEITLDNALKIIMVKSANDVSVTIAEGVGGSVENFSAMMNEASARLGMTQSNWVNPNGLPDSRQVTSARDMALLARALHREFPEARGLWSIGAIQFGSKYMANHNGLIGRYPGADGMKTGFTCAAGFNVVATASRGGRRLLAVVMGQPSASQRTAYTASMFDRGFSRPAAVASLSAMSAAGVGGAPDMRGTACVRRGKMSTWASEYEDLAAPIPSYAAAAVAHNPQLEFLFTQGQTSSRPTSGASASAYALAPRERAEPISVYLGRAPGWSGASVGPRGLAAAPARRGKPAQAAAALDEGTGLRLSDEIGLEAPAPRKAKAAVKAAKPGKPAKAEKAQTSGKTAKPAKAAKPQKVEKAPAGKAKAGQKQAAAHGKARPKAAEAND